MTSHTMFSLGNAVRPLVLLDRWLHPYRHQANVDMHGHTVMLRWTSRANDTLLARTQPLVVEAQLYFSCVIKKRVLFHETAAANDVPVVSPLNFRFRLVQASSCDPVEFARHYPEQQQLQPDAATNIRPRRVCLDHIRGQWVGEFEL